MYNINPFNPYQGINPAYIPSNLPSNTHGTNFNQIIKEMAEGAQRLTKCLLTHRRYCLMKRSRCCG